MPLILGSTPSRRDFLRTAALSAGAMLAAGACAGLPAKRRSSGKPIRWALMADTHVTLDPKEIQHGVNIDDNFKKAVAQIIAALPEGVIIAGDIARNEGKIDDYRMFQQLVEPIASRMPLAVAFGNHDDRENFRKVITLSKDGAAAPVKGKRVRVIESAGLRLVILDSLLSSKVTGGLLGKDQRDWLQKFLDQPDQRPTFLFFHHNMGDRDGCLLDGDRLLKIILPRKQVKAIFYGHSHVYAYAKIEDLHLINLPAVGYSFTDKEPLGWVDARLTAENGNFTLHAFASNTKDNGKTTSLVWRG